MWSFDWNLLVLNPYEDITLSKVQFHFCDLWIHSYNLPLNQMNREMAEMIGNNLGPFIDVDTDQDRVA